MEILDNDIKSSKCPILSRNSRPFKLLDRERKQQRDHKARLHEHEQVRMQGREYPSLATSEHEKALQTIATKGVVRLFNAVSHQQGELRREQLKEQKLTNELNLKKLELDKKKTNSNDMIIKKILARNKKWDVLADDEDKPEQQA